MIHAQFSAKGLQTKLCVTIKKKRFKSSVNLTKFQNT